MRLSRNLGLVAAIAGILASFAGATAVSAQGLIFDWNGDKTADSGKQHIRFNGPGKPGDIIVSFGDRKLYYFTAPGEADTYPVAIPREQSRWEGVTTVSNKRENPSWTPTAHMLAENPKLPHWVPGGHPMNPLGNRAMYLGSSDYRIHGTDAPWTIGTAASKGCVRMFNKDVADLYPRVKVGAKVTVTWQKFDGRMLAIADSAKPVADPDASPQNRAQLAAYDKNSVIEDKSARSKSRKSDDDEDNASANETGYKSKSATPEKPMANEESSSRRKRAKAVESADATVDTSEPANNSATTASSEVRTGRRKLTRTEAAVDKPSDGAAQASAAKSADSGAKFDTAGKADTAETPRRVRTASRAPVKQDASVISTPSTTSAEQSSLAVAERALAAAERAAQAAERAAAAAERAVAASEHRGQPISADPGSAEAAVVAH